VRPAVASSGVTTTSSLVPYVPRLTLEWARADEHVRRGDDSAWLAVDGTAVFADISGFTKMSERLARHGKVGAEEVTDAINTCFEQLLEIAYAAGGSLLKFGGDALLLLFSGENHALHAAHAAVGMRLRLRTVGRIHTSSGLVVLRISMGLHSGTFHVFAAGDSHRELVVAGPAATATVEAEGTATAGEIVMSAAAASVLPARCRGAARGDGFLLRSPPGPPPKHLAVAPVDALLGETEVPNYVPVAIRNHLLDGGEDSEHRSATVAFLHFDGTDEVLEREGAPALAAKLHEVVRVVQGAADEHEVTLLGTDIDHDGGKLILVAGVPRRIGDDEERMLTALRRISDAPLPLPLRIGAHTGPVFAGAVGPAYRRTFTVMGDTVNLAARVMSKAAPGEVLVTPDVLDRSQLAFETVALEPFSVKGKKRPVTAFALGAPKRARMRRSESLPLVGRARELEALDAGIVAVEAGATRAVEIVGEPGMGKSRLVEELRARASAGPHDLQGMTIRCEAYEASAPYAPFWVLLRYLLGAELTDSRDDVERLLRARLADIAPDLVASVSLLGTPLDLEIPDPEELAALEPAYRRQRVDEVTASFLERALPRPGVLVFEDVQHMDEPSVGLLRQLVGLAPQSMLFCVTRREAERGFVAPPEMDVRTFELAPLTAEEATRAVIAATEATPLLPHETRTIVERAAGNPLFLEEMLRSISGDGSLAELPSSIDAAVTAEIDRLPARHRQILRRAAVLGQSFGTDELAEILAPDLPAPDDATMRELGEFLVVDGPGRVRFRLAIMRDSAYEELPFKQRRELHGRAATALERSLGADLETEAALVSLHFLNAQRYEEAWRYARTAGERASGVYANVEAAVFFERAIAAARRLPEVARVDLAAVWEQLGDVRERAGAYDSSLRAYRSARRLLAANPLLEARLFLKEAWIPERMGRFSEAVRAVRKGLGVLEPVAGVEAARQRAELTAWYAALRQAQGRPREAVAWCERAIAEAKESGSLPAEAHASFILDWAWFEIGDFDQLTHSERALEIYVELGDVSGEASVLQNLGGFAFYRGRWDEAVALFERSRDARLRTGNDVDGAIATCNISEVLVQQGRFEEAERQLGEALRVCRAADYRSGTAFARSLLGRIAAHTGRPEEADDHFDAARREYSAAGLDGDVEETDTHRVECLVLQGRARDALALADETMRATAGDDSVERDLARLERVRGYALLQLGDHAAANVAFDTSLDAARARDADYEVALSLLALARLARAGGDLEATSAFEAEGHAILEPLGVRAVPDFPVAVIPAVVAGDR
jgi:class 3 adenylate cyclase/tetratricopeptide (TPR) repeat protein